MWPQYLKVGCECPVGGQEALDRERRHDVGVGEEVLGIVYREAEHPEDSIGAVGEGQALLLSQHHGRDSLLLQDIGSWRGPPVGDHLALTHENQPHVGQRGQIPARSEGSVLRHPWNDSGIQQPDETLGDDRPSAREPERQSSRPQEHHGPDRLGFHGRPHPGRVGTDQRTLQVRPSSGGDRGGRQGTETGRDSVCRISLRQALDYGARGTHTLQRCVRKAYSLPSAGNIDHVRNGHLWTIEQ